MEIETSIASKKHLNIMRNKFSALLFLALIMASCSQSDDIENATTMGENLSIAVGVEQLQTKGTMVDSEAKMGSIGLYCAYTADGVWSEGVEFNRMKNQRLDYNSTLSDWIYDADAAPTWDYTSIVDMYTFMAYSPYGDDDNGVVPTVVDGDLVVEYTVPQICQNQPDLMVAIPRKNIYPQVSGAVSLDFRHTLAAVGFSVKGISTEVIKSITIKNVFDSGSVTVSDSGKVAWDLISRSDLSYSAYINDELKPSPDSSSELTLDSGYLMMIPQTCDDIVVEVTIYNTVSESSSTKSLSLSGKEAWEAAQYYDYTINISDYDYTIEGTANSYMLHPNGEDQTFYIPVEGRINTFWRYYADDNETYKDMLSSSDEWSASVLWSDVDIDGFSVERVITGFSPSESVTPFCEPDFTTPDARSAMKITLPATVTEGNILVAVEFGGKILWSWHLWITEYNPDIIAARNSDRVREGRYIYRTRGVEGEVHRYDSDDLWETLYDDRFIMDRNLGARDCDYSSTREGVLHYQFGRKDPFPATNSLKVDDEEASVTFAEAVQNPTLFYTRKNLEFNWCVEGLSMTTEYLWFDKNVLNSESASGKSIFDPSPLGWRVPRYGTFTVLNNSNCEYDQDAKEMVYNGVIKLPMTGYRSNNSGNVNDYGEQGGLRLSTQKSTSYAYNLVYKSDIEESTNNTITDGFCIRCIEE